MDRLWAPWRVKYVTQAKKLKCIFCQKPKQKQDKNNFIIQRTPNAFSILNIYPYNTGHIMVAPYRHVKDIRSLKQAEILELMELVKLSLEVLDKKIKPHGYNIGFNIGRIAGAGFDGHVHIHIVPRWEGDTNFMPILTQTKVLSQSLEELYNLLKK